MRITEEAFTFDDVLLVPAYSQVLPREVSLVTRLTRNITLNIPLLSAAMDTVTEGKTAIAIAQEGVEVLERSYDDDGVRLKIRGSPQRINRILLSTEKWASKKKAL